MPGAADVPLSTAGPLASAGPLAASLGNGGMLGGLPSPELGKSFSAQRQMADAAGNPQKEGPPGCNLFIYYVPNIWTDNELQAHFAAYGNIISATVMVNPQTGSWHVGSTVYILSRVGSMKPVCVRSSDMPTHMPGRMSIHRPQQRLWFRELRQSDISASCHPGHERL